MIDILPDDVLLLIFHFDRVTYLDGLEDVDQPHLNWRWDRLVHVCRRWRSVVFASPNFLDLKLVCGPWTHVELIAIWPPLPIIIKKVFGRPLHHNCDPSAAILVAIVPPNRICQIDLVHISSSQLRLLALAMQEKFPALIHLKLGLSPFMGHPIPLPDGFLGGFAPHLQSLELRRIPFPALPKLLLSATDLVYLALWDIPQFGYISPEEIVTSLAVLASLKSLIIESNSPLSYLDRHPPLLTRIVLPALARFELRGPSEYLEEIAAQIDAPLLDFVQIAFFDRLIPDTPQLAQFMRRTPKFQALTEAHVDFDNDGGIVVESFSPTRAFEEESGLRISCEEFGGELPSLVGVLTSFFPSIYMVEHLYIYGSRHLLLLWQYIENTMNVQWQWLEIFHPFTSLKNLYISKEFAHCIAPALQELVGERARDALPALQSLFLEELQSSEPVQEAIGQFVAARQLLGHPVAVSRWNKTREALTSRF